MKKIKIIVSLFLVVAIFGSCELIIDEDTTDNISKISTYPIFEMKGGQYVTLKKGETFSDPGINVSEVEEGGSDLNGSVTTSGSVDTETPGLYFITYVAKNSYNHVDSIKRAVLVYEGDLSSNRDLTGEYKLGPGRMSISKNEILGFWNVGNIYMNNKDVPAVIGDIGNDNYVIVPAAYALSDEVGQYEGTAEYNDSNDKITFDFDLISSSGNVSSKSKKWSLIQK